MRGEKAARALGKFRVRCFRAAGADAISRMRPGARRTARTASTISGFTAIMRSKRRNTSPRSVRGRALGRPSDEAA